MNLGPLDLQSNALPLSYTPLILLIDLHGFEALQLKHAVVNTKAKFNKLNFHLSFVEMAAMQFSCNGHLLCCVNIPTFLLMFFNKFIVSILHYVL